MQWLNMIQYVPMGEYLAKLKVRPIMEIIPLLSSSSIISTST